ncbi:Ig [Candidatus Thiomargarita nelsonii]|uniref:Ig n=1 Tax=Candidatus Thiomargarita nelsonii TaxID=1003181 RepID=A0A0A6NYQ3_9GAMM|nr:Ig [Candidatus Thiomargarita nelsonii]
MGDPRFVDAPNGDFHLRSDSPAVDVGDSTLVNACSAYDNCDSSCQRNCDDSYSEECKKTCCQCSRYTYHFPRNDKGELIDLDGNPRLVGGAIDLGAFERQ